MRSISLETLILQQMNWNIIYIDVDGEPKGSAVTSKFSILMFSGKGVFSNNI